MMNLIQIHTCIDDLQTYMEELADVPRGEFVYTQRGVRWEEAEPLIATDPYASAFYATDMLKDRFELGEAAIATNAMMSVYYAREVLNGRFLQAEPVILNSFEIQDYNRCLREIGEKPLF